MFETVYAWILTCLQFAVNLFSNLLNATGTYGIYISSFVIVLSISAFFLPLNFKRAAGSDSAKKRDKTDSA